MYLGDWRIRYEEIQWIYNYHIYLHVLFIFTDGLHESSRDYNILSLKTVTLAVL